MKLTIIKAVHTAMKDHFTNLLNEQYKQSVFFCKLNEAGIVFKGFSLIDNWNVVVDFIGFPKDNTKEWDLYNTDESANHYPSDDLFSRNELFENYTESIKAITVKQNLVIGDDGNVKVTGDVDSKAAKTVLASHVEWLFNEYEKLLEISPV